MLAVRTLQKFYYKGFFINVSNQKPISPTSHSEFLFDSRVRHWTYTLCILKP